jgi:hypothetical protein
MKTTSPDYADFSTLPTHVLPRDTNPNSASHDSSSNSHNTILQAVGNSKKGGNDSVSDLLFLYNITFLSDSKVR